MSATASYNTPPTRRDQHPPPPSTPYGPDNLATSHSPMVRPGPPTIRMGRGVDQAGIVVDRRFIDGLAKDMQLPADLRGNLHRFATMAEGASITQGDYNLRLFSNALILQNTAEHRQYVKDNPISDFASVMADLKLRLDDSFHLTKNQVDNCRMVSQELICQSNRLHFKSLHVDVFKELSSRSKDLGFTNVFGKPNREAVLLGQLKRTTSSVRNAFREELRDSLFHLGKRRSLEAFSVHMVIKYRRIGVNESTSLSDIIRFALLRLFARENQDLLGVAEVVPTGSPSGSADEEAEAATESRKRKRGGRVPKSADFWEKSDEYFSERINANGRDLGKWTRELKKAVEYEMEAYPNAPVPSLITTTPIADDVGTTPSHSTDADWPQNMYEQYTGPGLAGNIPETPSQGRWRESDESEDLGDAGEGFDYYAGAASSSGHRLSGLLNPYH